MPIYDDSFGYAYVDGVKRYIMKREDIREKIKVGANLKVTHVKNGKVVKDEVIITKWFKNAIVGDDIKIYLPDIIKVEAMEITFKNPNLNNNTLNYNQLMKLTIKELESKLLSECKSKNMAMIKRVIDYKRSLRFNSKEDHRNRLIQQGVIHK